MRKRSNLVALHAMAIPSLLVLKLGFPPGNEANQSPGGRFGGPSGVVLQLFTPQAAEASRIHPSSPLAAAAWSCLSSDKISDKKRHRN